eukprot:scaffold255066_cov18-Prasinocladus_malaysianus.AAC.1
MATIQKACDARSIHGGDNYSCATHYLIGLQRTIIKVLKPGKIELEGHTARCKKQHNQQEA